MIFVSSNNVCTCVEQGLKLSNFFNFIFLIKYHVKKQNMLKKEVE